MKSENGRALTHLRCHPNLDRNAQKYKGNGIVGPLPAQFALLSQCLLSGAILGFRKTHNQRITNHQRIVIARWVLELFRLLLPSEDSKPPATTHLYRWEIDMARAASRSLAKSFRRQPQSSIKGLTDAQVVRRSHSPSRIEYEDGGPQHPPSDSS